MDLPFGEEEASLSSLNSMACLLLCPTSPFVLSSQTSSSGRLLLGKVRLPLLCRERATHLKCPSKLQYEHLKGMFTSYISCL